MRSVSIIEEVGKGNLPMLVVGEVGNTHQSMSIIGEVGKGNLPMLLKGDVG